MSILICGGRDFQDKDFLFQTMDDIVLGTRLLPDLVIHGGAKGADTLGGKWAHSRQIAVLILRADWDTFGRAAGPKRNQRMLEEHPDLVVAFPGGTGTQDMVSRARKAKIPVLQPKWSL